MENIKKLTQSNLLHLSVSS